MVGFDASSLQSLGKVFQSIVSIGMSIQVRKRSQLFIGTHNETLYVTVMWLAT
jgi:hypothetical protein